MRDNLTPWAAEDLLWLEGERERMELRAWEDDHDHKAAAVAEGWSAEPGCYLDGSRGVSEEEYREVMLEREGRKAKTLRAKDVTVTVGGVTFPVVCSAPRFSGDPGKPFSHYMDESRFRRNHKADFDGVDETAQGAPDLEGWTRFVDRKPAECQPIWLLECRSVTPLVYWSTYREGHLWDSAVAWLSRKYEDTANRPPVPAWALA